MDSHFTDKTITVLTDAVYNVFWKKSDVRQLFINAGVAQELINAQDWNDKKIRTISPILNALNTSPDGLGPLRRILAETLQYTDGDHLLWTSEGTKRKQEAERSLEHLRLLVKQNEADILEEQKKQKQIREQSNVIREKGAFLVKLSETKQRFYDYHADHNKQERGYGLERILHDLFLLFDLDPRGSFKIVGEQIDGSFEIKGTAT